jgi:hypothetical protein
MKTGHIDVEYGGMIFEEAVEMVFAENIFFFV